MNKGTVRISARIAWADLRSIRITLRRSARELYWRPTAASRTRTGQARQRAPHSLSCCRWWAACPGFPARRLFAASARRDSERADRAAVSSGCGCAAETGVVFDAGVVTGRQAGLEAAPASPLHARESLSFELTQRLAVELQGAELSLLFHRLSPSVALGVGSISGLTWMRGYLTPGYGTRHRPPSQAPADRQSSYRCCRAQVPGPARHLRPISGDDGSYLAMTPRIHRYGPYLEAMPHICRYGPYPQIRLISGDNAPYPGTMGHNLQICAISWMTAHIWR